MGNKKLLAVMLAAAMGAGCLAGCGQNTGSTEQVSSEAQESTPGETAADSEADIENSDNAEGLKTIKILGPDRSITDSTGTIVYLSDWANGDSKLWERLTSDLAERGVALELDLIPSDQYATTLQTMIAKGLDCDFVNITSLDNKTREQMVQRGNLVTVNKIREQYSSAETNEYFTSGYGYETARLNTMEDGNQYWLSSITIGDYNGEPWGGFADLMIRWDWLQKLNLEFPETTDDLFNVLQQFQKQDANGDGSQNEVASIGLEGFYNGVAQMFGLGTDVVYLEYGTGKVTSPFYQDGIKDYINYMKKLYEAGLLDTSGQTNVLQAENKISAGLSWWIETWTEPTITVGEGEAAPYLVGVLCDAGNGYTPLVVRQNGIQKTNYDYAVTPNADPQAIGILFDYLASEEYSILSEYGIEGYTYEVVDGVKVKLPANDNSEVQIISMGPALWVNDSIFPRYEITDRVQELISCEEGGYTAGYPETGFREKAQVLRDVYENPDNYSYAVMNTEGNIAVATAEQLEKISEIQTDLNTYYKELLSDLIMGRKSMDDWDRYISELQELGLDELISITQARYDRANQ